MTERLSINNIGTKGLNTDISPWDLPPEFLTNAFNFKVGLNSVYSTGGYADWDAPTTGFNAGFLMSSGNTSGNYWIVAGRTEVDCFDGFTFTDISSAAGYAGLSTNDELLWTGCNLGNIPVVNNPQAHPEYWSPASPGQVLQPLMWDAANTWAVQGVTCRVIRAHKNFLFALNITDVTEKPDTYRWSTAADTNSLPVTWDETDTAYIAGVASLGGDGGDIVDGLTLRDSFIIYSRKAIDVLDYTGGEFIWKRRELSDTIGCLNTNCVVEANGFHYFISQNDVMRTDGTTIESIIHGSIKNKFLDELDYTRFRMCFVMHNANKKEVWFCIPTGGTDYASRAYVYNWQEKTWAIRDLPNCAYAAFGILYAGTVGPAGLGGDGYGDNSGAPAGASPTWANWAGTWENQSGTWNSGSFGLGTTTTLPDGTPDPGGTPYTYNLQTEFADAPVCVLNSDSSLKILEPISGITSGTRQTTLERTNFPLDGLQQVTTITEVYPKIRGISPVSIQFGSHKLPGGSITWKPAITFTPGTDRKLNIRSTGSLHAWRIVSEGITDWELTGMDIVYERNGVR